MDRKKSVSHIVLPIFYKVAPSDVRHLKGNFGNAFQSRRECFDEKDIQEGQRALTEVSYLNGWESQKIADGHEGKLIERVVETVISKLQEDFRLDVPEQLVGLDDHMKEIMNWIDNPSTNARMIGIYGMGGIGKTTLAKCIYNQLSNKFVHVSFLPDVRETTQRDSIMCLQSQLIFDILQRKSKVSRIDDGISIIKSSFKGKKVLILLDDIDDKNQLDALARERHWFMAGSVIIVTTRNEAILDQSKFKVDYKYELNELDKVQALLLFNRHAFHMDHSLREFEGVSCDIISNMAGLPLALQVVGSYLYKKMNRKVWEDVREQLKNEPHRDVQKILRISYDALEDGHKHIFLDIACFLIGKRSKFAMYMWEDYGLYPHQGIEELKLRCLIKIGYDGQFKMHDQLRDLGRSIFCPGQPLEKRSRPWEDDYKGVPKVLRSNGMIRPSRSPSWFCKILQRCPSCFCDICPTASSKTFNKLLSEVRWLQWEYKNECDLCLPTTNLHLSKLSKLLVLDMGCINITEDWQGWKSLASKRLKVLNLSCCNRLRCTRNLSTFTLLKVLILRRCDGLERLHPSIGKLTSLVFLDLSECGNLKQLPEEVGELKNLEELILDGSSIAEIPTSIGSLKKLEKLSIINCHSLREFPSSIGDLQNLQDLNLCCSSIKKLPSSIGSLRKLEKLNLGGYHLRREIPSSVGDLQNLQHLHLGSSMIEKLPSAIGRLKNLRTLNISFCFSLKGAIPSEIGDLPSLEYLNLNSTSISNLPESVRNLSSLQRLGLQSCYKLRSLPELPSGLTNLLVTCQSLGLPQISNLIHLEELNLAVSHLIEDIRELPSIQSIENRNKLKSLSLHGFMYLEELSIKTCNSIKTLSLSQLICLKRLHIEHCDSLVEIKGYGNLESLEVIFLYKCKCLKKLMVFGYGNPVEIQGLDGAKFLEELIFSRCKSVETLPDLTGFEKLRSLIVRDCKKLTQLQGLEKFNLIDLDISGCDSLEPIPNLPGTRVYRNYERERSFDSWSGVSE